MKTMKVLLETGKFALLVALFLVCFVAGGALFVTGLPDIPSDPGPIPSPFDLVVVSAGHTLVIWLLIKRSRWYGWKLALALAFAYYGCVTFLSQLETWYFLTDLTLGEGTLRGLFLAGLFPALVFIPLAVVILGKWRRAEGAHGMGEPVQTSRMPLGQWVLKFVVVGLVYVALYFSAGYFIAWQNPAVRAFYGGGELVSFWRMAQNTFSDLPFVLFQVMRGMLWALFALPVMRMMKGRPWQLALLVGLLFSVPMSIGILLPNPLIPDASVRMSHLVEIASSNFTFGLIVTWLLHRRHTSLRDVLGLHRAEAVQGVPRPLSPDIPQH